MRHARLPSVVLVLLGAWFLTGTVFQFEGHTYSVLFDDAMISMRYARNLAQGFGFTWNPGDVPVEGASSMLWVLVMAGIHLAGVPEPLAPLAVSLLGLAILVALVHVAAALAEDLEIGAGKLAAWLVVLSYPCFYWTLRGFEVGAGALVLTSAALLVLSEENVEAIEGSALGWFSRATRRRHAQQRNRRRYLGTAALIGAGILLRDDMVVPLAVVAAFSSQRLGLLGFLGSVVGVKTLGRLAYFGDPLPLTAYLKLGGVPLGTRLYRGGLTLGPMLLHGLWLPIMGCVLCSHWRLPCALIAAELGYSIWVGGDAWDLDTGFANRFITPVLPVALVALASIAVRLRTYVERPVWWGWYVVLFTLITSGGPWIRHAIEGSSEFFSDRFHVIHGLVLEAATDSSASIAVIQAGNEGYYCHRRLIDQLGHSDARIAHEPLELRGEPWKPGHSKIDPEYVFGALRPDVVDEVYLRSQDYSPMTDWGYVQVDPVLWVRRDSELVDLRRMLDLGHWDREQWQSAQAAGGRTW